MYKSNDRNGQEYTCKKKKKEEKATIKMIIA